MNEIKVSKGTESIKAEVERQAVSPRSQRTQITLGGFMFLVQKCHNQLCSFHRERWCVRKGAVQPNLTWPCQVTLIHKHITLFSQEGGIVVQRNATRKETPYWLQNIKLLKFKDSNKRFWQSSTLSTSKVTTHLKRKFRGNLSTHRLISVTS